VPEVADTSLFLLNESPLPERAGVTTPLSQLLETRDSRLGSDNDHFRFAYTRSARIMRALLEPRMSLHYDGSPRVIDHLALRDSERSRRAAIS